MKFVLLSFAALSLVAVPVLAQTSQAQTTKKAQRRVCAVEADTGSNLRRAARQCRNLTAEEAEMEKNQRDIEQARSSPRGYVDDLPPVAGANPK